MSDISLTSQLRARGLNDDDLARLRRRGDLVRVRRGAYALPSKLEPVDTWDAEDRHRLLIAATAPQLASGAVISHASAAVLHGLPTWPEALNRVHVSRSRNYGGKTRTVVAVHCAPFLPTEVIEIDGIPTTTLARTVVDLARSRPFEEAVAAGDRALTLRLAPATLISVMRRMERWPNIRQARRVVAFLDARSESAGESVSRVRIADEGLPAPQLQRQITNAYGRAIGRVDFCWDAQRTIGEFDGKIKYGRLLEPGQTSQDVIFAEKLREDELRDNGWQVVRWLWGDLYRPGVLRGRLIRAFTRAG
ncbi:MAG TPA: type IV toxin-antitoxin system AbiEi family antitoxin domain-containing protein [Propionibacteriaceae bacterium]|nr:type IV toxin-antitoxin system AbiEi family antitoxin domain-containing protein [Propionibacteriaceae bacterium]